VGRGSEKPALPFKIYLGMTRCKGPHHDLDDFTTYDLTTFTTSRLVIDLETGLTVQKWVSRSITSRKVVKVVKSEVVKSSKSWCGPLHFVICQSLVRARPTPIGIISDPSHGKFPLGLGLEKW